jgi:tetratricopeptide (TPR) repeat protein
MDDRSDDRMLPLKELLDRENLDDLSGAAALDWIAQVVDASGDAMDERGLRRSLAWCDAFEERQFDEEAETASLNYFRANAWAWLEQLRYRTEGNDGRWSWDQPEVEQQILCLRSALGAAGFDRLELGRKCQIFTNLANQLNSSGRPVEALEYWDRALSLVPEFWMARGNRGISLAHYGLALHDPGHRESFFLFALRDLDEAARPDPRTKDWGDPAALQAFQTWKGRVEEAIRDVGATAAQLDREYPLGRSASERGYRRWCLQNKLFLNPLNDLASHTVAARDVLSLPDFVTSLDEPPVVTGFFNQMKQEFVSARWEYYLSIQGDRTHFSDRDVLLYNTLDYPAYGLSVERVKGAYKCAYSLFDKIAFFLNHYFTLGANPNRIYFRSIWREKNGDPIHPVRERFRKSENWPLRGLFWLSKDLFDERQAVVTEPDARDLHELRINLEHKYVKVHEMSLRSAREGSRPDPFSDTLAYSITRESLESRTMRLLKLVRAALIYTALAMHREEGLRRRARGDGLVVPMHLDPLPDEWKA